MGIFKRKQINPEDIVEEIDLDDDITLFAMANVEDELKKNKTSVNNWTADFANLSDDEKRELVVLKEQVSEHFIRHGNKFYLGTVDDPNRELAQREFESKLYNQFSEKRVPEKYRHIIADMIINGGWDYYFLSPLIEHKDIQDIHVYAWDKISVLLTDGTRYDTGATFLDEQDYRNFISRVAIRNKRGQSNNNAIIKFTDKDSSEHFRLRFDILTEYVTSTGQPYLHIRKHPKIKYTVKDLYEFGAFRDDKVKDHIFNAVKNGESMLFTGKNNSAKTTMLNALIDIISEQKNIFIVEDNEELHSETRGGIVYTHSVENKLEGKVTYSLSDIAETSLLCDVDVVIVGEIKNDSAKGLMKAAYVGVQCFSTSHGQSAIDGYYKLADYVKQATTYDLDDCLRFLAGFKNLVYMENKKISEIVVVSGLDDDRKPVFTPIYNIKEGGWLNKNSETEVC